MKPRPPQIPRTVSAGNYYEFPYLYFKDNLLVSNGKVVGLFVMGWQPICNDARRLMMNLAQGGVFPDVTFVCINTLWKQDHEACPDHKIGTLPTTILFNQGEELARIMGSKAHAPTQEDPVRAWILETYRAARPCP